VDVTNGSLESRNKLLIAHQFSLHPRYHALGYAYAADTCRLKHCARQCR